MGYYRAMDPNSLASGAISESWTPRYAWLEHEAGTWHFLTSLFADSRESTRRWSSRKHALDELLSEGWVIVGSYPENPSVPRPEGGGAGGYGLMRVGMDKHP